MIFAVLLMLVTSSASAQRPPSAEGVLLPRGGQNGFSPFDGQPLAASTNAPRRNSPDVGWHPSWPRGWRAVRAAMSTPRYRLPGEFEHQRAFVVSCHEFIDDMPELLANIVAQLQGHVEVIALVNDVSEYQRAKDNLVQHGVTLDSVQFAEVPHDTMWCRDYGPIMVQGPRGAVAAVDTEYVRGVRPQDDDVPIELSRQLHVPMMIAPLRIEGGNLLSNGQGLCITTRHVLETNADQQDEYAVRGALRQCFGAEQIVFLEPLSGEPTGHVDMFATFTSPTTVVVAKADPDEDFENAEILDRNAERLARVVTQAGLLRVVRVPMPKRAVEAWRTYTNVVYANGVVLVPVYPGQDDQRGAVALNTYRRLLPGWRVAAIDANRVIELGGAMHCLTMNLGPIKDIPRLPAPRKMIEDLSVIANSSSILESAGRLQFNRA